MKHCQWCDKNFDSEIKYQIYCCAECRQKATKEKIAARYQISRRRNRKGKTRLCKSCNLPLSIYNDESLCNSCKVNPKEVLKSLKDIKGKANEKD